MKLAFNLTNLVSLAPPAFTITNNTLPKTRKQWALSQVSFEKPTYYNLSFFELDGLYKVSKG